MHNKTEQNNTAGFALASVLVFLLLLAAFLTPFAIAARVRLLTQEHIFDDARYSNQLNVLAKVSAINFGTLTQSQKVSILGRPFNCDFGSKELFVRFTDHSGLIDLNASGERLLAIGLEAINVSNSDNIAKEIVKFRSRRTGAEQSSIEIEYGYKHGPFEAISELHDFAALRTISLNDLEDTFTTQKKSGILNISFAPPHLRKIVEQKISANNLPFVVDERNPSNIISVDLLIESAPSVWQRQKLTGRVETDFKQSFIKPVKSSVHSMKAAWVKRAILISTENCALVFGTDVLDFLGADI